MQIIRKRSKTLHIHYHTLRKSPWILPSHNRSWRSDFSIKAMVVKWWLRWSWNHELVNNQTNCAFLLYHCIVIIFILILLMFIQKCFALEARIHFVMGRQYDRVLEYIGFYLLWVLCLFLFFFDDNFSLDTTFWQEIDWLFWNILVFYFQSKFDGKRLSAPFVWELANQLPDCLFIYMSDECLSLQHCPNFAFLQIMAFLVDLIRPGFG